MKLPRRVLAIASATLMLMRYVTPALACGPFLTQPIFAFKESPDLPFEDFASGNIGIVRPSLGRKTLVVAYRYVNGGSFTGEEQQELIAALRGAAPEPDSTSGIKAWIKTRKEIFGEDQQLPEIYTERQSGGYDFFPNCTQNAFAVATETLKDRVATYGAASNDVKTWLAAQDTVFENCSSGSHIPSALANDSPEWSRKDRDYQIAAAHFYSLNFAEARTRFELIAADVDSPWRELAAYLVGRTLVRQASLTTDETKKQEVYELAEGYLQKLIPYGGKFASDAQKLMNLVKYHLRPAERIVELSQALAGGTDDNVRQDLIDYVWLLDKLEEQARKEEEERKKKLNPPTPEEKREDEAGAQFGKERYERIERGEYISLWMEPKTSASGLSETRSYSIDFPYDTSEANILNAFALTLRRQLTAEEIDEVKERHKTALADRQWKLNPNRKWDRGGASRYDGCHGYFCAKVPLDLLPQPMRSTDLSDWIITLQTDDPRTYRHAFAKWRDTGSHAWLIAALTKADKSAPQVAQLIHAAESIASDDPSFPTITYHLVRLKAALGDADEARKLLDEMLAARADVLPPSAKNLFIEQRKTIAKNLGEFLKSAQRKPIAFYNEAGVGKLSDLMAREKAFYDARFWAETKEESDQEVEESYKPLLAWDDRFAFDARTTDAFNWHFSLQLMAEAARNEDVPDYLRRRLLTAAWTRAILLNKDDVALSLAPELLNIAPEMASVMTPYLKSRTLKQRRYAALYALLKFPELSPYVADYLSDSLKTEESDYYLETAWWCTLPETEYNDEGNEVRKVVSPPSFLTAEQLETAGRERLALRAYGDAKGYLGKQVIEWAKNSPLDPRIPEALFIAVKANESYKYGCNGWDNDEQTRSAAEKLLRERYEQSPWTAKLPQSDNQ